MVKIVEFAENPVQDDKMNFDVVDDVLTFMRNNPKFYRRNYFPAMVGLQDKIRKNEKINPKKSLAGMIEMACESYCDHFSVGRNKDNLLTDEDKEILVNRIFDEELDSLRKGEY